MAFATDSNRPQPVWQPPTPYLTVFGAASKVSTLLLPPPHPGRVRKQWPATNVTDLIRFCFSPLSTS